MDFHGRRVTIMGLGHFGGGAAAARWLAGRGAVVTVTDLAAEETLADALAGLNGTPIAAFHLGGHREEDFQRADLVVVNPAVKPQSPWLALARAAGVRLTSEIELFLSACPARMVGVTGSNGKSTTAAMTAAILQAAGCRTWLGGNIGRSLLADLEQIDAADWAVLELSSFQLWHLGPAAKVPQIAMITNCSPNHLDWHGTWPHYVAAKQRLLTGQAAADAAVLNPHDAEVSSWRPLVRGRCLEPLAMEQLPPLAVPGRHNRINAACAAAAATAAGCDEAAICRGLQAFRPLAQRLELCAEIGGRRFYNDSTATTPESAIAALESLAGPLWLLAGGRDKGFALGPLAAAIVRRAAGAAFFGTAAAVLERETRVVDPEFSCIAVGTMAEALAWCWRRSRPGEAIVLSPACASTDQFRNFRHRGQEFVERVRTLDVPPISVAPYP